LTVDGVVTGKGDLVLVAGEATATHNGLYRVATAGAIGVAAVLIRAAWLNQDSDVMGGVHFMTGSEGLNYPLTTFVLSAPPSGNTINTTNLAFLPIAGPGDSAVLTPANKARAVITSIQAYGGTTTGVLTETGTSALSAADGVTLAVGDVVLLPAGTVNISAASDAGPYVVTALGGNRSPMGVCRCSGTASCAATRGIRLQK
jgi:hypothetical protein